jgi:autotransporter-associated beta strand protein
MCRFHRILTSLLCLVLALCAAPAIVRADLVGNYTADANTLVLLHFDQSGNTSLVTNYGTLGSNFYTANMTSGSHTASTTVTNMTGRPSYVSGPTNFGNCLAPDNSSTFGVCGWDFNNNGSYNLDSDAFPQKRLNIGNGAQTPFTLEAIVCPTNGTLTTGQFICTDSSLASRGFQFNLSSGGVITFNFVTSGGSMSGTIPATGNNALVNNQWYHVAFTYDGTNGTIYWTLLNGTNGAASVLASQALNLGIAAGNVTGELSIGNIGRNVSQAPFQGYIDEVRISSVARKSGQMQFNSPRVTITQNPVSQNVDYNLPVTFTVGASSDNPLSYQWRFNSNPIAGATNTSYTIANTAATDAGNYDCVVTNTIGFTNVSSVASLVVGAANFLGNRYSFNTNYIDPLSGLTVTPDSIGGQTATNIGSAYETNGSLVLDGTTDTFVQLPPNLFTATNATALTVEFWATLGTNPNNVDVFAFGKTNFVIGSGIVGFFDVQYSPHTSVGQLAVVNNNSQSVTAAGNLDGQTVHVAVVVDAPDKTLAIYTNGVLEAVNTNFTVNLSSLNDQISWIGRSLTVANPNLVANIDELRIFRGALSPISILQSHVQGPNIPLAGGPASFLAQPSNTTVPLGQSATFSVATLGYLPITYQWYQNGSPIAGATNFSYTYIPVLGDNGATFNCHASNTVGVTTYVTNSASATLNVFLPPMLTWVGSVNNLWNTTDANWLGGIPFTQTNGVLFDSNGSSQPTVDITQATVPYNVTVNAATDYLLTSSAGNGSLNGASAINKLGVGKLTLDLTNNLSGPVTISGGILQVGNSDALGSLGSSVVTNNATLSIARGDSLLNVGNTIHGTGVLSVDVIGAVTISGNSDFSGATLLNSGVTFLTSATGLGSSASGTTVASGALLYVTANVNLDERLTLNGSALQKGGGGLTVDTAPVALASDSTISLDGGATLVLSNAISGSFNLTAAGNVSGTLTLTTNSTISGFALNGPVVNVRSGGALGLGAVTATGTGRFVLADGINVTNAISASSFSPGAATGFIMVGDNTNKKVTT